MEHIHGITWMKTLNLEILLSFCLLQLFLFLGNERISTYHSVLAVQMKNWDPLVLGPALAIDKTPTEQQLNLSLKKKPTHTHQIKGSQTLCTMLPPSGQNEHCFLSFVAYSFRLFFSKKRSNIHTKLHFYTTKNNITHGFQMPYLKNNKQLPCLPGPVCFSLKFSSGNFHP